MKPFLIVFTFLVLIIVCNVETARACSFTYPSIREEFHDSKYVFFGEVLAIDDVANKKQLSDEMNRFISAKVKFRIIKSWKGKIRRMEMTFYTDFMCAICGDVNNYFKVGEKILIATEKNFVSRCAKRFSSDTEKEMKKLDSFRFRAWAAIYPF